MYTSEGSTPEFDHFCTRLDCPDAVEGTILVGIQSVEEPLAGQARLIIKQPMNDLAAKDYKGRRVEIKFGYEIEGA